jgi:hypothetical protein
MIHLSLGQMSRLGQMNGPIQINFREQGEQGFICYLNMDGEYMKIYNAKSIKMRLSEHLKDGTIKILRRKRI